MSIPLFVAAQIPAPGARALAKESLWFSPSRAGRATIQAMRRFAPYVPFLLAVLFLVACERPPNAAGGPTPTPSSARPTVTPPKGDVATVTEVIDGDTLEVKLGGKSWRLRYIGVDAPEREEPFYEEALDFNRNLVAGGTVILVKDVSETDQYGRLLRYVYLEDGTFVNAELIRHGLARLVTFPPDVAQTSFLKDLQAEARAAGAGMWGRPDLTGPCDCDRNLYDCRDFDTQDTAQACFNYCWEVEGRDVHNLDGGGDGRVCESLP